MRVLGIETSCDETAAAVVECAISKLSPWQPRILSNVVHSQIDLHAIYGGVVPELASRAHIRAIQPIIIEALRQANITTAELNGVAVTAGPGLVGALLVGVAVAKGLALAQGIPLIGVHHMEGHLLSPFLSANMADQAAFPFMALLVSGGHTLLVLAQSEGVYLPIGTTLDDAVGEAFDKGAKMLGLGYPGGPAIAALAEGGNPNACAFPRALPDKTRFDFSFSGLKTSLRTLLLREPLATMSQARRQDVAASYQEAIAAVLVTKSLAACHHHGIRQLMVAGGVGANRRLRALLAEQAPRFGITPFFPPLTLCTDNGAMIAFAGLTRLAQGQQSTMTLNADPRWSLQALVGTG